MDVVLVDAEGGAVNNKIVAFPASVSCLDSRRRKFHLPRQITLDVNLETEISKWLTREKAKTYVTEILWQFLSSLFFPRARQIHSLCRRSIVRELDVHVIHRSSSLKR
jgi:hypothetical protein